MAIHLSHRFRNIAALALSVLVMPACGSHSLKPNESTRRRTADATRGDDVPARDGGSLALALPATNPIFAGVTHAEIKILPQKKPAIGLIEGSRSDPPSLQPLKVSEDIGPCGTQLPVRGDFTSPIVIARLVPYTAGTQVTIGSVPAGPVEILITLLDHEKKSLYEGYGTSAIKTNQTASAVVYVVPTPFGRGGLGIDIKPAEGAENTAPETPILGGYQPVSNQDPGVLKAAAFALGKIKPAGDYKLLGVTNAASQVVAGTNIAFTMNISSGSHSESHFVIVFLSLDDSMTLREDELRGQAFTPQGFK